MRDAADLRAALIGQHLVQTDSTEVVANISEVMVMPQPYGSLYAQTLTPSGDINPNHTFIRTGVCDVGTYTVDLALDDDGVYVDAESGSVESGVYTAQERIAAALERDYRQKMPFKIVEEVLRTGHFRASGEDVNYSTEVQDALEPLRSATLNLMGEKWKAGKTVDVIYLSGGGAELVKELVMAAYKQTQVVKNPQIANARGYLNYAYFKAQE
jgi:plasmid segregation protein ParM